MESRPQGALPFVEKPPGLMLNPFPPRGGGAGSRMQQSNTLRDELPFIPEKEEYAGKNAFLSPIDNEAEPREAEANYVEFGSDSTEGSESMSVEERDMFLFRSPTTTPESDRSALKSCKLESFFSPLKTNRVGLDELSAGPPLLDLTRLMMQPLKTQTPPKGELRKDLPRRTDGQHNGTDIDNSIDDSPVRKRSVLPETLLNKVTDIVRDKVSDGGKINENERSEPCTLNSDVNQNVTCAALNDPAVDHGGAQQSTGKEETSDEKQKTNAPSGKRGKIHHQQGKKRKRDMATAQGERKGRKQRPNYFVAVQITNPQIKDHLSKVQDHIVQQEKLLSTALVPPPTQHLTLHVSHLATDEDIKRAGNALDACRDELLSEWGSDPAPLLHIQSLGSFQHKVLFANIADDEGRKGLYRIADKVSECLEREGIESTDQRALNAHLTIFKLSKNPALFRKVGKIKPLLYKSYEDADFGWQRVLGLQLCSMDEKKGSDGYYQVAHAVNFDLPEGEPPDGSAGRTVKFASKVATSLATKEELVMELHWNFHMPNECDEPL